MKYAEVYKILEKIYLNKAYSNIELQKECGEDKQVFKTVKGVLENEFRINRVLFELIEKKPKNKILIILKIAVYLLCFDENSKNYAVVNEAVNFAKSIGKGEVCGFINAVLKKASEFKLPPQFKNLTEEISYKGNIPEYLAEIYLNNYGKSNTELCFENKPKKYHILVNGIKWSKEEFENFLKINKIDFTSSCAGGYIIENNEKLSQLFNEGKITYISLCSALIANECEKETLDLCSAPGGKSIAATLNGCNVTVCDIHSHRLKLIDSYFKRMSLEYKEKFLNDATVRKDEFAEKFDTVLLDVPCTGFGVSDIRPDILLNRKKEDIYTLSKLQSAILNTSCGYVKKGGALIYSTCTVTKEENSFQIKKFLETYDNFVLERCKTKGDIFDFGEQYLPIREGFGGFFSAKLRRIK